MNKTHFQLLMVLLIMLLAADTTAATAADGATAAATTIAAAVPDNRLRGQRWWSYKCVRGRFQPLLAVGPVAERSKAIGRTSVRGEKSKT